MLFQFSSDMVITGQTVSDEIAEVLGVGGGKKSESSASEDAGESILQVKGFTTGMGFNTGGVVGVGGGGKYSSL